jgi:hypothetical protein
MGACSQDRSIIASGYADIMLRTPPYTANMCSRPLIIVNLSIASKSTERLYQKTGYIKKPGSDWRNPSERFRYDPEPVA